jgi:hypothetical protein
MMTVIHIDAAAQRTAWLTRVKPACSSSFAACDASEWSATTGKAHRTAAKAQWMVLMLRRQKHRTRTMSERLAAPYLPYSGAGMRGARIYRA